jgi:hypothetical protein
LGLWGGVPGRRCRMSCAPSCSGSVGLLRRSAEARSQRRDFDSPQRQLLVGRPREGGLGELVISSRGTAAGRRDITHMVSGQVEAAVQQLLLRDID